MLGVPVAWQAGQGFVTEELVVLPEEAGRRQLWLLREGEEPAWRLRIPERMFSDQAVLVGHDIRQVHTPVRWDRQGDAWFYRRQNREDLPSGTPRFPIEYRVGAEPAAEGIQLTLTVKNLGREVLHNVVGHICLGHLKESFRDPRYERTYLRAGGRFLNLRETDRGPDPIRAHYRVQRYRPIRLFATGRNPFWGPLSPEQADNGLILTRSQDGKGLVALWFEPASELFQNSDEANMCIHSDPVFGDLSPGSSATVTGRIVLFEGSLAEFERQYFKGATSAAHR